MAGAWWPARSSRFNERRAQRERQVSNSRPTAGEGAGTTLVPVLPNHRFDETRLAQYLSTRLEGFAPPCTIRQFQGGQSNPTFLLETSEQRYVLRKKPPGKLLPSAHAVEREYQVISALADSPIPVPRPYLLCEDDSIIGQPFYVMAYVDGRVFSDPELPGLEPAQRSAIYDAMNATLAELHRIDIDRIGLRSFGRPEQFIARQIARWTRQYQATELGDSPAMDRLIEWLPAQDPGPDEVAVHHGDFRLGNLIFHRSEPRVLAVLDWELATLGHPIADLAYNCLAYRGLAPAARAGLTAGIAVEGIPSEQQYVAAYCRRVGRSGILNWPFFIVFQLFRAAAILAGVHRRALNGNAADARALEHSSVYRALAERAWEIATHAGAT
jgi:aminoglycoside phosphotransferase (APT) family kinase protein